MLHTPDRPVLSLAGLMQSWARANTGLSGVCFIHQTGQYSALQAACCPGQGRVLACLVYASYTRQASTHPCRPHAVLGKGGYWPVWCMLHTADKPALTLAGLMLSWAREDTGLSGVCFIHQTSQHSPLQASCCPGQGRVLACLVYASYTRQASTHPCRPHAVLGKGGYWPVWCMLHTPDRPVLSLAGRMQACLVYASYTRQASTHPCRPHAVLGKGGYWPVWCMLHTADKPALTLAGLMLSWARESAGLSGVCS